jgi:hypothetical protein
VRRRLYSALSWAGFGNAAPGLWANPHVDRMGEVKTVIEELGLRESAIVSIGQLADACGSSRAAQIEPPPCTRARTTSTAGAPVPGEAIPLVTAGSRLKYGVDSGVGRVYASAERLGRGPGSVELGQLGSVVGDGQ